MVTDCQVRKLMKLLNGGADVVVGVGEVRDG